MDQNENFKILLYKVFDEHTRKINKINRKVNIILVCVLVVTFYILKYVIAFSMLAFRFGN